MILVDTSVWVDHFRRRSARLAESLEAGFVACHPFIIGEVALGHLQRRAEVLSLMASLPQVSRSPDAEVLRFVETHQLAGSGLGWVDVHLLCAANRERLFLWTEDRRLAAAAGRVGTY